MKKKLIIPFFGVLSALLLFSCVKDTDFSQADAITLTPVVELNLIFFDLTASDFFDETTNIPRLTVSDTTELRFLDGSFAQEDLREADFLFVFTNSFDQELQADFQFLSKENDTTYITATAIASGTIGTPVVTQFTETILGEDIVALTQANKVIVSVTIPEADATLVGNLNLKSKTTYYLEIDNQ